MSSLTHTLFYFVLALTVLIAVHEYGHYWAARRLGVGVLRFSLGFGPVIWRYQKAEGKTEFVLSAFPIGGYVKMVDEREGPVSDEDLGRAFSRKSVPAKMAIVLAGPIANFILAILVYWTALMWGETGSMPLLDTPVAGSLAEQSGFKRGDLIRSVDSVETPIWSLAISGIMDRALEEEVVQVVVQTQTGADVVRQIQVNSDQAEHPEALIKQLGFRMFEPDLEPIIGRIEPQSVAEEVGLKSGDRIITADGSPIHHWKEWVEYVRARAEQKIKMGFEREGVRLEVTLIPRALQTEGGTIGRMGAAVLVPEDILKSLEVEYRLPPLKALGSAIERTAQYSWMTLKMVGRMIVGKAAVENLSGPISIAQYAGQSASLGFSHFMKFLALISISLGVLNLLPVPVLDGGHFLFYIIEAVRGEALPEKAQVRFQQIGFIILLSLMILAFYLDIGRLFGN